MTGPADFEPSFRQPTIMLTPPVDHDLGRGRKRYRSTTRSTVKGLRPEESSTLRGRSPRRATSPFPPASRNSSPSMLSSATQMLHDNQLRSARREHCPSRTGGTRSEQQPPRRRQQRTRSRSRGPPRAELHRHRLADMPSSSFRNKLLQEHPYNNEGGE
ncbi:hypothetical protein DCS_00317 [Drechmeria coniospora]|uniref:Uncharacterized protein n=1 Tax=Drechmeria coniospora TaxID=98403 RepID=A0A151GPZ7_DRECN|nr:hypothetical protein DCS_00317 [Drechmeria coniospora]KYK59187.1 hypothetical protein DCS_00317 [Drechmeria coniospora]ODA77935.1 hypothetical protein RJ55_06538 [Drechmeria coniospora]